MRYQGPAEISKEEFLRLVDVADVPGLCQAVVDAVHFIDDYDWLRNSFASLLQHPESQVRGVTATCVGHLARLSELANKEELLGLLQPFLSDEAIIGQVEDAIDDVVMFAE